MESIGTYRKWFDAQLFPLRKCVVGDPKSKQPLESEWQIRTYTDAELAEYVRQGHGIGWALGPRDIVLDLDVATAERPGKQGDRVKPLLENLLGDTALTTVVESPTGGRHYYLYLPDYVDAGSLRSKIRELPDVDILRNRQYVVIAGSPHWQGGRYEFSVDTQLFGGFERSKVNDSLLRLLAKDKVIESEQVEAAVLTPSLLDGILEHLPTTDYREHAEWFSIMAACHHCTEGSEEGLESFLHWSLADPKYADDREKIAKRWSSLDAHKSRGYTLGTLLHEVRRYGREDVITQVRLAMEFGVPMEADPPVDMLDFSALDLPGPAEKDDRPRIEHTHNEYALNRILVEILAKQPEMYARLDQLYYMEVKGGTLHSRRLKAVSICELLSRYCELGEYKGRLSKWTSKLFPTRIGEQIESHEQWEGMKVLRRVTPMPIMTEHGVHQTPGYEPTTGLFYHAPDMALIPRVPRRPDRQQAEGALAVLVDLVDEFPFAEDCHRSAWLASLLGVVARPILGPCAPMTVVDGNRAGAGKGMLCDLISDICLGPGQFAAKFTGLDRNEDEQRKVFLALARENPIIGIFDNFKSGGSIGSPVLDAILTTGVVHGRMLGLTKIVHAVFDSVLFATANRIQIDSGSDLLRRIFYILLETPAEKPEERTFKYPEVRAHAQANRGKYLSAALTVMEAARTHRDQLPRVAPWGSYTGYDLVRQALVWLGEADPRDGVSQLADRHQGATELSQVLDALELIGLDKTTMTARQIWDALQGDEFEDAQERKAIYEEARRILVPPWAKGDPVKGISARLMRHFRDQMCGGRWLRADLNPHKKIQMFTLRFAQPEEITPF
jgi:hypothetical protein